MCRCGDPTFNALGTHGVVLDLGHSVLGRLAAQIPIIKSLYGDQKERVNVNAGLTFLF